MILAFFSFLKKFVTKNKMKIYIILTNSAQNNKNGNNYGQCSIRYTAETIKPVQVVLKTIEENITSEVKNKMKG